MHLIGYTSTTKNYKIAQSFAFQNITEDQIPVIFEIEFHGEVGLFELDDEFTAYPGENEVLV